MTSRKKVVIREILYQAVNRTAATSCHRPCVGILGKLTMSHSSCFGLIQCDCLWESEQRDWSLGPKVARNGSNWLDEVSTMA